MVKFETLTWETNGYESGREGHTMHGSAPCFLVFSSVLYPFLWRVKNCCYQQLSM